MLPRGFLNLECRGVLPGADLRRILGLARLGGSQMGRVKPLPPGSAPAFSLKCDPIGLIYVATWLRGWFHLFKKLLYVCVSLVIFYIRIMCLF